MSKKRFTNTTGLPSQRQLRVGEQVRQGLSEFMQRGHFHDPVLMNSAAITVTSVDMSPDLKNATAFVMPLGGLNADEVITALNKASGMFRSDLGKRLDLRFTPKLFFRADTSFDTADEINTLLRQQKAKQGNFTDEEE